MTNVPLSQINIDSDLPLGGTKKITDARQIGLKENDTVGAKTAVIEINSAGQVVIGDGTNPVVPFFSVVTGKVVGGALPVGNEVLSTVVAPTVTNTFLKAVVAGPNISFVWEAVSGGSFALSGDPSPTLAGDMVTGTNKVKKGAAGTDAYIKMGTSLIEVGTGAGVSYTIPTTVVAHKPVKMNAAGDAIEFANIRAVDVGLAATYSGNLAAAAPTTVEALGTAVDGLDTGVKAAGTHYIIKDDFDNITPQTFTTFAEATDGVWSYFGFESNSTQIAPTVAGEAGVLKIATTAYALSRIGVYKKSGIFYTGQEFKMKAKVRHMTIVGTESSVIFVGLIKPTAGFNALLTGANFNIAQGIYTKGSLSGSGNSLIWAGTVENTGGTSPSGTVNTVNDYALIEIKKSATGVSFSYDGGASYSAEITTNLPNNVELIPFIGIVTTASQTSEMKFDYIELELSDPSRGVYV